MLNRRIALEYRYPELKCFKPIETTCDYDIRNRNAETGEEEFYWYTTEIPKPTDEEMQIWYDEAIVIQCRVKAYAEMGNQDEMRFDDLINGTTTWKDAILAIKAEFPKP